MTGLGQMQQAAEAHATHNRWRRLRGEAWVSLRVWGSPLPHSAACADWAVQGQRLGLTDGSAEEGGSGSEGLCPPNGPTPDGRAKPEGVGAAGPLLNWKVTAWNQNLCGNLTAKTLHPRGWCRLSSFQLDPSSPRTQPDANEPCCCCGGSASLSSCWGPSHRSRHP